MSEAHPADQQMYFAVKAVEHRELYYQGLAEAIALHGPIEGPVVWAETKKASNLANNNKWHMQQSEMFGSIAQTRTLQAVLAESRIQTEILRQLYYKEGGTKLALDGRLKQAGLL